VTRLEFWPDYEGALLHADGAPVELETLGLPAELVERARRWVGAYDDAKLDPERRDEAWVAEGRALFAELRRELVARGLEIFDWEGYWGEPGTGPADVG
jgi:hypothetical protein